MNTITLVLDADSDYERSCEENSRHMAASRNYDQKQKRNYTIFQLITPGELIHPEIDEMSVMTYLSQFPAAKLDEVKRELPEEPIASGSLMDLNAFPVVNMPTEFVVNIVGDGYKPKMKIIDPDGREVHYTVAEEDPHKFIITYTPLRDGIYHISLALRDLALGTVTPVEAATRTIEALPIVRLCSYPERVRVGDPVPLRVEGAIRGVVEVVVVDALGGEHQLAVIGELALSKYQITLRNYITDQV
ncbi:unnamed protein product [Cylicostephanus goldi]|uniref:Uncharacterized protein n=1 Tax=Cylicostephanus goldi TaxID=71465 RepID=A0A3P6QI07_CYLGO|nr:unnamed protein product [Cylicostephanus goldi]